jgi:hypothetical protein
MTFFNRRMKAGVRVTQLTNLVSRSTVNVTEAAMSVAGYHGWSRRTASGTS